MGPPDSKLYLDLIVIMIHNPRLNYVDACVVRERIVKMPSMAAEMDLNQVRDIIKREAQAVERMADVLDNDFFNSVKMLHDCKGSIVVTGIGKAGLVGQKISATLSSVGAPSHFLHAAEAIHGDLGTLREDDVAVVLSYSGASEEIVRLIALIKQLGVKMIAITGDKSSPLAQHSEHTIWLGNLEEVCPLGLAPTTSTTCMIVVGDALALTVMKLRNFQAKDYARYHPGGSLGRKLITVEQAALFNREKKLPIARDNVTVQQALLDAEKSSDLRHGCVMLVDSNGRLSGLLTDGDLRRGIEGKRQDIHDLSVADIMTNNPTVVKPATLASEAMAIFHKLRIDEIPVVDADNKPVGLIDVQDVLALKVIQ